jgi:hypothetical protein
VSLSGSLDSDPLHIFEDVPLARWPQLFLAANEWDLEVDDDALIDVTFAAARGELSAEALAIWFRQRTRSRER